MKKKILANLLFYTGISYLLFRIRLLSTGIRVINYHCTPNYSVTQFKKQLKFYKKYFEDVNLIKLSNFYDKTDNGLRKSPGLIISFDDGLNELIRAVFIRAPWVEKVSDTVQVLASIDNHPVAVRSKTALATSFHPEITGDNRIHRYFIEQVARPVLQKVK